MNIIFFNIFFYKLWEWDTRKKWDEYIAEAFTIEQVTPHQDYSYFSVVTPYGITSRDV